MGRRPAMTAAVIALLLTSAIASAGIYSVVNAIQQEVAMFDDTTHNADEIDVTLDEESDDEFAVPEVEPGQLPPPRDIGLGDATEETRVEVSRLSSGQLVPANRADVHVVRDARVIESLPLGRDGVAQIDDVAEGLYTLVIRGTDGYAVVRAPLHSRETLLRVGLCP